MFNLFLVAHDDGKFIDFGEAGLDALVSIVGVFLVLLIIIGAVKLLSLIKSKKQEEKVAAPQPCASSLGAVDVNNEEMMAAVLVASIDFYEETKEAPHVVGVKELN